jgi:hypothetical protein
VEYYLTFQIDTYDEKGNKVTDPNKQYRLTVENDSLADNHISTESKTYVTSCTNFTFQSRAIVYRIDGTGNPKKDTYDLSILAPSYYESVSPTAGSYVIIQMTAKTANTNSYSKTLSATFRYEVSTEEDYLTVQKSTKTENQATTATVTLTTKQIPNMGVTSRTVEIWWDTSTWRVNQFNHTFNELRREGKYQQTYKTVNGKTYSVLKVSTGSFSTRTFEFFLQGEASGEDIIKNINPDAISESTTDTIGYYLVPITVSSQTSE